MRALLTGMEFEPALGALGGRVSLFLQNVTALRTAGNRPAARHLNGAGAESVFADRSLPLLLFGSMFLISVLIAVLTIFCYDATSA